MGNTYGYVRVSTREQNEERQLIALNEAQVPGKNIYVDKKSGKDFNRPMYQRLLRKLKQDDLLYIKSIDRLGRDYEEILKQWRLLTKEKKIDIVVLDMPLLDTRRGKDLVGTFLSDVVLQVLSFVAENERVNIRERQREGIEAAKMRGVRFGRPPKPLPVNFQKACSRYIMGEISGKEAASQCNMPVSSFYRKAILTANLTTECRNTTKTLTGTEKKYIMNKTGKQPEERDYGIEQKAREGNEGYSAGGDADT